jgi:hypothetical protein
LQLTQKASFVFCTKQRPLFGQLNLALGEQITKHTNVYSTENSTTNNRSRIFHVIPCGRGNVDDDLERNDVENAILKGIIEKKMTHDERGTRYRIEGPAIDGRMMHVICRFRENSNLIIVTVYAI